jgi:hypothetical protein
MADLDDVNSLARELEEDLTARYGPMVSNETLRIALGYPSNEAFRQALTRKTVPIPVFTMPNRRGKYALVKDLAAWLAASRDAVVQMAEGKAKTKI